MASKTTRRRNTAPMRRRNTAPAWKKVAVVLSAPVAVLVVMSLLDASSWSFLPFAVLTVAAATATVSTAKGKKLQLEASRRDIAPSTATGADNTTATFFHAGAVFLLRMGAVFLLLVVFDAMVDSSEAVGAHPSTQEGSAVRGRTLPAGEEARRLLGGAVQQGLGPLVDVVGSEAELLEQGPGRR